VKSRFVYCGTWRVIRVLAAWVLAIPCVSAAAPVVQDLGGGQYRVTFTYQAPPETRTVHVAGTFNGWSLSANPMQRPDEHGPFAAAVTLEQGRYEYKFVLNGNQWETDPDNPLRVAPYDNAVVFVGMEPTPMGPDVVRPTAAVDMAARMAHPPQLDDLATSIRGAGPAGAATAAATWLVAHPMPLLQDGSLTAVCCEPSAEAVFLSIRGAGFWTAYDMPRLVPGVPVFAVSLKRERIPDGSVYRFDVESAGRTRTRVDPYAWTVTSRAGQPVGVVANADRRRSRIQLVRDIEPSAGGVKSRDLYVYCPPGYETDRADRYPVLYMHDGQNCWDDPNEPFGHGGWHVNVTADRLIAAGQVEPFIVVAIPNTPERMEEYGPGASIFAGDDHAYIRYLIRDVKPLIDKRFRTRPGPADTAVMGSSMGGLVSLQAGLLSPDVFGKVACLSPALWYEDRADKGYFDLLAEVGKVPVCVYLDSGTAGPRADGAADTRRLGQALIEAGWTDGVDLLRYEHTGASHNERAWRARLDRPLKFLFPPSGP
jgi:predicted alpha/beta superfamily hydrolase